LGWSETNSIVDEQFLERHEKNPSEKIIIALLLSNLLILKSNQKLVESVVRGPWSVVTDAKRIAHSVNGARRKAQGKLFRIEDFFFWRVQ
jgi:hypothetical protein